MELNFVTVILCIHDAVDNLTLTSLQAARIQARRPEQTR